MENQTIENDIWKWIHVRIGYYVGELFISKFGGYWMINGVLDSITFDRYVVGGFSPVKDNSKVVDYFKIALEYIKVQPPRNQKRYLEMVEKQLL